MNIFTSLKHSRSLVKKHLTPDIYQRLKGLRSPNGFTLSHAVQSGIENLDSDVGIYAGDEASYQIFAPLFDPIIRSYHGKAVHNTPPDFHIPSLLDLDPERQYILSSRIRIARNLRGFSFPCHMSLTERQSLETKIKRGLDSLPKDLNGTYHSLDTVDATHLSQLKRNGFGFEKGDRFQDAAGFNTDFPKCRGIYLSVDKQFILWVNEEDHLRIICMARTPDLAGIFRRLGRAVRVLDQRFEFAYERSRGFLTSCPTNIGTTMRAGVHIQLKKLEHKMERLTSIARRHHLQIRGTSGEKTEVRQSIFDISNKQRMGISESDIIQTLHKGLSEIIAAEQSL